MITLNIPPQKQALLEQVSRQAGMSIEQYIINKAISPSYQLSNELEQALQTEMKALTIDDVVNKSNVWQPNEKESKVISNVLNDSTPPNDNLKAILALHKANDVAQYEQFNFDLERMEQAINSGFVEMPNNLNSLEDFNKWVSSVNLPNDDYLE